MSELNLNIILEIVIKVCINSFFKEKVKRNTFRARDGPICV